MYDLEADDNLGTNCAFCGHTCSKCCRCEDLPDETESDLGPADLSDARFDHQRIESEILSRRFH